MTKPLPLLITPGDPAGIGPDILLSMASQSLPRKIIAVADLGMLLARANTLGLAVECVESHIDGGDDPTHRPGVLPVHHVPMPGEILPGRPDISVVPYLLRTLDVALEACLSNRAHGLVTGPLQKSLFMDAGVSFSGHTEYLAEKAGAQHVVMMLASHQMRVALQTTHIPLSKVSSAITQDKLNATIRVLMRVMSDQLGVLKPRVGVCGLNPHAGEGGHIGREELDVITPVLQKWQKEGHDIVGPLSADTAFTPERLVDFDVILAMFHDQGLPVIKAQGFGEIVNITLGLPCIRTSVDHGVALDLAGSGLAKNDSLRAAVIQADQMCLPSQGFGIKL